jgi:UDP-N-acetylmuramoyl-L-alanyl-D-glutamate--2,6-diaminopimelate ligase
LLEAVVRVLAPEHRPDQPLDARSLDVACTGVSLDSRQAAPGSVFFALRGQQVDGAAFAAQAIARGAVAVVAERPPDEPADVPWVVVGDARLALALAAAEFHGHPSRRLRVVGTTGTNGKTTTSWLVAAIFEAADIRCGVMGTVSYRMAAREVPAARTTPEAPDVQQMLDEMAGAGCGACAMEVSSHALALRRVDGTRFAAGIFTNLTRDHLDFHGDMDSYFTAKRRLFEMLPAGAPAVVNVDDARGGALVEIVERPVTYALDAAADVTAGPLETSLGGLRFEARTPAGPVRVRSRLTGRPNAYNLLAAVGAATALDVPVEAIERGIEHLDAVPGRFQVVSGADDEVTVVVDYAHTDDALRNLLETARALAPARVITVFGAGGDRDRQKRPLMARSVEAGADVAVLTTDNPRGEDAQAIQDEVLSGFFNPEAVKVIADRYEAIGWALSEARPGDCVLVAGKGHEDYQIIGHERTEFDDRQVARDWLYRIGAETAVARPENGHSM